LLTADDGVDRRDGQLTLSWYVARRMRWLTADVDVPKNGDVTGAGWVTFSVVEQSCMSSLVADRAEGDLPLCRGNLGTGRSYKATLLWRTMTWTLIGWNGVDL